MKIKILLLLFFIPCFGFSQDNTENNLNDEVQSLKAQLRFERSRVNELNARIMMLENGFSTLSDSIQKQQQANLELQAQNERALNLALDEFSKKFEEQNKTMEGVQSSLDDHYRQQLLLYIIGLIAFVVALFIGIKMSTKRALENHKQSWNEFNEHIIKR